MVTFKFRHRVNELVKSGGGVDGVRGDILAPSDVERGRKSSREIVGAFELKAQAVIVTSGGIGGNHDLVRQKLAAAPRPRAEADDHRRARLCRRPHAGDHARPPAAPSSTATGCGTTSKGSRTGVRSGRDHAIRIIPGPSSLWLDARGRRLPVPLYPGFDTLATLKHIGETGYDYSWFILTRKIIEKEFALSGSEQNPDFTSKSWRQVIARARAGIPGPVKAFMDKGEDFIVEHDLARLIERMNALVGGAPLLDAATVEREIVARDRQLDNAYSKDMQIAAIRAARRYLGDKLTRTVSPHKLLDPAAGPLIAVRLHILTRKTLGGLQTDLDSRVIGAGGQPVAGLYAAGEVAGFGGGGMHGYAALEGTFLGGCIFSGRIAGRAAARSVG